MNVLFLQSLFCFRTNGATVPALAVSATDVLLPVFQFGLWHRKHRYRCWPNKASIGQHESQEDYQVDIDRRLSSAGPPAFHPV
jgi:hypothetical protein